MRSKNTKKNKITSAKCKNTKNRIGLTVELKIHLQAFHVILVSVVAEPFVELVEDRLGNNLSQNNALKFLTSKW